MPQPSLLGSKHRLVDEVMDEFHADDMNDVQHQRLYLALGKLNQSELLLLKLAIMQRVRLSDK